MENKNDSSIRVACIHCNKEYLYPKELVDYLVLPYECNNCKLQIREIWGRRI